MCVCVIYIYIYIYLYIYIYICRYAYIQLRGTVLHSNIAWKSPVTRSKFIARKIVKLLEDDGNLVFESTEGLRHLTHDIILIG